MKRPKSRKFYPAGIGTLSSKYKKFNFFTKNFSLFFMNFQINNIKKSLTRTNAILFMGNIYSLINILFNSKYKSLR